MDTPTTSNATFVFHDLPVNPNTKITMTVTNADGTTTSVFIELLKPVADTYRTMTKAQLVNVINRTNADTII